MTSGFQVTILSVLVWNIKARRGRERQGEERNEEILRKSRQEENERNRSRHTRTNKQNQARATAIVTPKAAYWSSSASLTTCIVVDCQMNKRTLICKALRNRPEFQKRLVPWSLKNKSERVDSMWFIISGRMRLQLAVFKLINFEKETLKAIECLNGVFLVALVNC